MIKTLTWISLGLSILGAIADFASPDRSDAETAAEIAMLAKVLLQPRERTACGLKAP